MSPKWEKLRRPMFGPMMSAADVSAMDRYVYDLETTALLHVSSLQARVAEIEGFVSDEAKAQQRHLDQGSIERDYWHYGYVMALKDVIRMADRSTPQKVEQ